MKTKRKVTRFPIKEPKAVSTNGRRHNTSNKIGASFEERVQTACNQLAETGVAYISKVPTDWCIIRRGNRVVNAYPRGKSKFVDFVGVLQGGFPISLETKTTANKTSFALNNILETEYEYMRVFDRLGGCSYYLIEFRPHQKVFMIYSMKVEEFKNNNTRKSIPYCWFIENAIELDYTELNFEDYLLTCKE